jgi:hypothetical protein
MAEEHEENRSESEESNGHNLGRAAMIAAASGATAYAARKALSGRSSTDDEGGKTKSNAKASSDSSASLVTAAVASGWDVAKDSLIPVVEDAATKAGVFVAERAPEVVRDVVIPRFIAGFERAKRGTDKSES